MILLAVSLLLGFLTTLVGTQYAKKYLLSSGIFGVDQQKEGKPKLPTSGGIAVLFGFFVSVTSYLGFVAFFETGAFNVATVLAALSSVLVISLIGLLDDIHINLDVIIEEELELDGVDLTLQERVGKLSMPHEFLWDSSGKSGEEPVMIRKGIGQLPKMLFVLPAALPLIAVGAGSWTMHFLGIGAVNWGIIYPLVLLPVGLLFVSNVVNMLAGTNGLSAAMSFVASTALGIFAYITGSTEAALIAFSLSASLLAFLRYNLYPASILPGDSLTYLCGAAMFAAIVIGNIEKFAVFIFIPWFAEFFLKLRSGFQAHSWGILQEDGTLEPQHEKTYSLTHPLMRRGLTEKQVTLALVGIETLICASGLILFNAGIL